MCGLMRRMKRVSCYRSELERGILGRFWMCCICMAFWEMGLKKEICIIVPRRVKIYKICLQSRRAEITFISDGENCYRGCLRRIV